MSKRTQFFNIRLGNESDIQRAKIIIYFLSHKNIYGQANKTKQLKNHNLDNLIHDLQYTSRDRHLRLCWMSRERLYIILRKIYFLRVQQHNILFRTVWPDSVSVKCLMIKCLKLNRMKNEKFPPQEFGLDTKQTRPLSSPPAAREKWNIKLFSLPN